MWMEPRSNSTSATSTASAEAPAATWDSMLLVGIVARTQGIRGEVVVNATTDFVDDRFGEGAELFGRRVPSGPVERLTIAHFRMHLGRPAVIFGGVTSINDAERFTGWELRVPAETARIATVDSLSETGAREAPRLSAVPVLAGGLIYAGVNALVTGALLGHTRRRRRAATGELLDRSV